MCLLCPENQIKLDPGDTENCTSCDGESNIPNAGHNECGEAQWNAKHTLFFKI